MPAKYTRVDCTCEHCGALFTRPASAMKKAGGGRFCSNQCKGKAFRGEDSPRWRGGNVERACEQCGESFVTRMTLVRVGRGRFCSHSCAGQYKLAHARVRTSTRYREWRMAVLARDGLTCQHCRTSKPAPSLCAHHVKSWADHPDLRFDPDNGLTLCQSCHFKLHKPSRWANT